MRYRYIERKKLDILWRCGRSMAIGAALLLMVFSPVIRQAFGHKGHGKEVGEYNLDAPRKVSEETAEHMGLKTSEVDLQPIEEVIELSGVVKPLPDRHEFIVARVDSQVTKVHIRVGETVKKGDIIVTVSRAEGTPIPLKLEYIETGVVTRLSAAPGHWAERGEVMAEVVDYRVVQVEGELPESLIPRVRDRKSDKVRIRIPADPSFLAEGTLRYIAPELDPVKRTAHLIVDVPNPSNALRGEMWVDLSVILREVKSALVVPRSAVVVNGPMHFVFIQDEDQYIKQDIVPGFTNDKFVEVKEGLAPGDIVVIQGAYSLTQIRPKPSANAEEKEYK